MVILNLSREKDVIGSGSPFKQACSSPMVSLGFFVVRHTKNMG